MVLSCTVDTVVAHLAKEMLGEMLSKVGSATYANPALFPIQLSTLTVMMIPSDTTSLGDVSHMILFSLWCGGSEAHA